MATRDALKQRRLRRLYERATDGGGVGDGRATKRAIESGTAEGRRPRAADNELRTAGGDDTGGRAWNVWQNGGK
jgi:hypothetical protein